MTTEETQDLETRRAHQKRDQQAHDFCDAVRAQAELNYITWGHQSLATLGIVLAEEMGEVARAILQNMHEGQPADRILHEAIDTAAVCVTVAQVYFQHIHICAIASGKEGTTSGGAPC
jgi:NTP pyrophosphatase (non-canonical NTP hydrolase)